MKNTQHNAVTKNKVFAVLLDTCRQLRFDRHDIARILDKRSHYDLPLDKEFPFHISLFRFRHSHNTPIRNWHERLELTMPLDGTLRMRMGDSIVELAAGDLLVVDNLKLHNVEDFPGLDTRVIVMSFMPEFVYSPGAPTCDYAFLLPFYAKREGYPHILRATDKLAIPVYIAISELLNRFFQANNRSHYHSGCKASFLQILYQLTQRFHASEMLRSEFVKRRQQADRLARLFEYVRQNYSDRITVEQATLLVHMSQSQFMKLFKLVSGTTFVAHVTRVRITNAMRLLRETDLTIAEVAAKVGFSDQSYFDRRFKQTVGKSPHKWRQQLVASHITTTQSEKA